MPARQCWVIIITLIFESSSGYLVLPCRHQVFFVKAKKYSLLQKSCADLLLGRRRQEYMYHKMIHVFLPTLATFAQKFSKYDK